MNDLASKLTLVIPTHYRHHYLERALTYYRGSGLSPLVIDSTNVPFPRLAEFPGVDYRHCPDMPLLKKLTGPVMEMATPYMVFCADDSFIIPRAAAACVDFLDAHPDYHVAHGRQVSVTRVQDKGAAKEEGNAGWRLEYAPCYTQDELQVMDSDSPAERLKQLYQHYSPTFYAVHRIGCMQDFITASSGRKINDVMLELVNAMAGVISGKHAILPLLYHVTEVVPSILDDKKRRLPGASDIILKPEHRADYEDFVAAMAELFAARTGADAARSRQAILDSMAEYIARHASTPRRPFWKKLPRYAVNTLAGLGWNSRDHGSWAETKAHAASLKSPEERLTALMALFDEKARTELDSIRAVMRDYYANRP